VYKALMEPQASQVMWVPLVRQAYREKLALQVQAVYKETLVPLVQLVHRALKAQQAYRAK
jgi:hypothetical protein